MSLHQTIHATVFIATSLDGFIARKDGGIDWLDAPDSAPDVDDYGYAALMESVDGIVMGRKTFDTALSFGEWPYGDKPVVVLSSEAVAIPPALADSVVATGGDPDDIVRFLRSRDIERVYIDGGVTIQRFLNAGRIDRLIITTIPVIIGTGIPLFGPTPHDIALRHARTMAYANGLVQRTYDVVR